MLRIFVFLDPLPTAAATLKGASRSEHGRQVNFVPGGLRSHAVFSGNVLLGSRLRRWLSQKLAGVSREAAKKLRKG